MNLAAYAKLVLAGCAIYDSENRLLLIHRNTPERVQWEMVGGKVEPGESAEAAAIREVKEEIGVDVEIIRELDTKEFAEDGHIMKYVWFLAKITKGVPKPLEEKHDQIAYFSKGELCEIESELSPNTHNFLVSTNSEGLVQLSS